MFRPRNLWLLLVVLVLVFAFSSVAFANSGYMSKLPADLQAKSCAQCHPNSVPPALNDFGKSFKANGYKYVAPTTTKPSSTTTQPKTTTTTPAQPAVTQPVSQKVKVTVDGKANEINAVNVKGSLLLQLRDLSTVLQGGIGQWDAVAKAVTFKMSGKNIILTVGKDKAQVDGKDVAMAQAASIIAGRVMVPVRFVAEAIGAQVSYDATKGVTITLAAAPSEDQAGVSNQLVDKSGALPGYVGTQVCKACHESKYYAWATTGHARHVREVSQPGATTANFAATTNVDPSSLLYAIGGITKQYFVDKDLKLVGMAWDQENKLWLDNPSLAGRDYLGCAQCHTVGFNAETKKAADLNIGCEDCHGPGEGHVAGGGDVTKITVSVSNDVCGSCHSGQKTQLETMGEQFATNGVPKDGHANKFKNNLENNANYKDTCLKCHSATAFFDNKHGTPATIADFKAGGKYEDDRNGITCVVCHSPHKRSRDAQLSKDPQTTCTQCHTNDGPLVAGKAPHHSQKEFFEGKGIGVEVTAPKTAQCIDCHMAGGNHYFKPGTPTLTLIEKSKPVEYNPCSKCHSESLTAAEITEKQEFVEEQYTELSALLKAKQAEFAAAAGLSDEAKAEIKTLLDASITNLGLIEGDNSKGIHNYPFAEALIQKTTEDLAKVDTLL